MSESGNQETRKSDGGAAFPRNIHYYGSGSRADMSGERAGYGMSLRDYFAAKAMPILLKVAEVAEYQGVIMNVPAERLRSDIAQTSYLMADAMLEARGK